MRNCNCSNTIRQNKDDIRERAIKFAVTMEEDVQIHSWTQRGFGRLWDFEPLGSVERGKGVVEIIKFRDYQSKDVLPDSEGIEPDSKGEKKHGRKSTRKPKGSGGKPKSKVD